MFCASGPTAAAPATVPVVEIKERRETVFVGSFGLGASDMGLLLGGTGGGGGFSVVECV